eukprot:394399-Alexandrium_andersonii.AAC.1
MAQELTGWNDRSPAQARGQKAGQAPPPGNGESVLFKSGRSGHSHAVIGSHATRGRGPSKDE